MLHTSKERDDGNWEGKGSGSKDRNTFVSRSRESRETLVNEEELG